MSDKLLYNIVQLHEWPSEETKVVEEKPPCSNMLKATYEASLAAFRKSFHALRLAGLPYQQANSHSILNALYQMSREKHWLFSVNPLCSHFALLQQHQLEVRCLDEELSITGSFSLPEDCHKSKGFISWEQGGSIFACALGNGTVCICDTTCSVICSIELTSNTSVGEEAYNICTLMFMPARSQKSTWTFELFILLNNGLLLNYFLSAKGDFQLHHTFNFAGFHLQGITCALMDTSSRLLVIGGNIHCGYMDDDEITGDKLGMTKWRILSDYPYYKKDLGETNSSKGTSKKNFLRRTYFYTSNALQRFYATPMHGVYMMSLSPDQLKLVAVHFNGSISLWDFPSMRVRNIWELKDQPCHDDVNPSMTSRFGRKRRLDDYAPIRSYPYDISWWSNNAVSISRCSGCFTILSVAGSELVNMFGSHCEWLAPFCHISPCFDERFYLLECHKTPANKKMKLDDDDDDDDDDSSFIQRGFSHLQVMIGFKEIKIKERNDNRKYSLLTFTKTTPQELYERKIDDKEYGEALSIAQAYNLDCDKVFQRQWRNAPISRASIQDYLSKVKNQLWVYRECMERVPEHIDDMKELMEFALSITDIDKLALLCNPNLEETFVPEEIEDYHGFDYNLQRQREREKRALFETQWMRHVNFKKLTLEQNEMMKCRQRILKHKDRLSTYILLQGGYDAASEQYTSDDFAIFRRRDLFQLALEYAHASKWEAVETLLQFHYEQLQEHWLPLLLNFPETVSPSSYSSLLPEVNQGQVVKLEKLLHRNVADWCEADVTLEQVFDADEFYDGHPHLVKFMTKSLTPCLVNEWYEMRARSIEKLSHLTEEALRLIDLGNERGATGLSQLRFDLETLDNLLFECGSDLALNLDDLLRKTPLERIRLMMAESISTTYVRDIQRFVIPFVKMFDGDLFQTYLLETAQKDLALPFVVFKHMLANKGADFDFRDADHVVETALDCIYAKEEPDQLDIAQRMLNCLPKHEAVGGLQRDKVSLMERTLECCRLLAKHKNPHTPQQLRFITEDPHQIQLLFMRVARSFTRDAIVSASQCKILLEDLKSIASKMFPAQMEQTKCIYVLIESLLASAIEDNIRLAGDMMVRSEGERASGRSANRLPYSSSVSLVLSASKEYFDAASIPLANNKLLHISKLCLLLISDHPPLIREQLDLIEAVALLCDFGLEMLPLEVRLCKDRLEIVEKVLSLSPNSHAKLEALLRLSSLLNVTDPIGGQPQGRTLCLIAKKALERMDLKTAGKVVRSVLEMNYPPCWELCYKLATRKEVDDVKFRYSCITFACCYCNDDNLPSVTDALCNITALRLEQDLEEQVVMEEEEFLEAGDELHEVPSLMPGSHTLKTSVQLIAGTVNVTTGVIKSGLAMLKKESKEPTHAPTSSPQHREPIADEADDFEIQSCPSFYRSLLPTAKNDLYSTLSGNNILYTSAMETLQQQIMLRISAYAGMPERMVESLRNLAILTLPRDLPLGLSYLLALPESSTVEQCFHSLPLTSLSLQTQVYYNALQVLSKFYVSFAEFPWYRAGPSFLVDYAIEHCDVTGRSGSSDELQRAVFALVTFIQGEKLSHLRQDIDMRRCLADSLYARDTVHGLAMTTNEEQLLVAILLAEQWSCDVWQVALTHVEYLFTETQGGVNEPKLFDALNRLHILPLLVSRGKDFYERFDSRVFPLIDGRDHPTLLCYFNLLNECNPTDIASCVSSKNICNLPPQVHAEYLHEIMELAAGLDYKLIISKNSSPQILSSLKDHLCEDNVQKLANLLSKIPYQNERISESSVILQWVDRYFWTGSENNSDVYWLKRFDSCITWLLHLNASDMKIFFEDLLYSQSSIEMFSYKLRGQLLNDALKFVKTTRSNKLKISSNPPGFAAVKSGLEKLKVHFAVFANPFMREVIVMAENDQKMKEFLRKFDTTRSELDKVLPIAVQLTYESVEFTKKFLSAVPNLRITFEKALTQCCIKLTGTLSEAADDPEKRKSGLSQLCRLLSSIEAYPGKEKKRLFNQVVTSVQKFCDNETVSIDLKIEVLQLLRKSAALSKAQSEFLLYHRAKELVVSGWGGDVADKLLQDVESISKEGFQRQLIASLLEEGRSFEQVKSLSSLVELLSQDSCSAGAADDMWLAVLTAYAKHSFSGGEEIVDEAKRRKFSTKVSSSVFELLSSQSLVLAAVKFALITKLPGCTGTIRTLLKSVNEISPANCDDELLRLLIDSNLVIDTLSTLYYHRVVHYLTSENYNAAEHQVDRLVRQLQDCGFISEAATLLLRYRGSHTAFATFGTSMSLVSNWMKNN